MGFIYDHGKQVLSHFSFISHSFFDDPGKWRFPHHSMRFVCSYEHVLNKIDDWWMVSENRKARRLFVATMF
jgi:hypothetical protein